MWNEDETTTRENFKTFIKDNELKINADQRYN